MPTDPTRGRPTGVSPLEELARRIAKVKEAVGAAPALPLRRPQAQVTHSIDSLLRAPRAGSGFLAALVSVGRRAQIGRKARVGTEELQGVFARRVRFLDAGHRANRGGFYSVCPANQRLQRRSSSSDGTQQPTKRRGFDEPGDGGGVHGIPSRIGSMVQCSIG